jgi:hypothetical protein
MCPHSAWLARSLDIDFYEVIEAGADNRNGGQLPDVGPRRRYCCANDVRSQHTADPIQQTLPISKQALLHEPSDRSAYRPRLVTTDNKPWTEDGGAPTGMLTRARVLGRRLGEE